MPARSRLQPLLLALALAVGGPAAAQDAGFEPRTGDAWVDTWLAPAFADWSLQEVLPQVCCPTLVLHGANDEYGSSRQPQQIAGQVAATAQLEILPGVQHVPHREQPELVLQRIAGFLAATRWPQCR